MEESPKPKGTEELIRELDKLSRTSVGIIKNLEKNSTIDYDALNNLIDKVDTMRLRRELHESNSKSSNSKEMATDEDEAHNFFMGNYQNILKKKGPREAPKQGKKPTLALIQSNKWLSRYDATPGKYHKEEENRNLQQKNITLSAITKVNVADLEPKLDFRVSDVSGKSKQALEKINEDVHKSSKYAFLSKQDWRKENQMIPWKAPGKAHFISSNGRFGRGYLSCPMQKQEIQELPGLGHTYQRSLDHKKCTLKEKLSKPPVNRTYSDDQMVFEICRKFKAFSKLPDIVLRELCTVMSYVRYEKGQSLCEYGDIIPPLHIIVRGQVKLIIEETVEERVLKAQKVSKGENEGEDEEHSQADSADENVNEDDSEYEFQKKTVYTKQILEEFEHFGDTGVVSFAGLGTSKFDDRVKLTKNELLAHYERRCTNFTLKVDDTFAGFCECVLIKKSEYDRAIRQAHVKDIESKVAFLSKCKPFKKWATSQVNRLADLTKWETVEAGTMLLDQGYPVNGIYFVREGECSALRKADAIEDMNFNDPEGNESGTKNSQGNVHKKHNYVEMGTLRQFDYFGEHSTLLSTPAMYSVIAKTPTVSLGHIPAHVVPEAIDNSTVQYVLHRNKRGKKSRKDKWKNISQMEINTKFLIQSKQQEWMKFKEDVVKDVINRKNAKLSINSIRR
eukprot:Nk52_evm12s223 gene=Nk52_evmTU12s223